jgi:hypothetical protein
MGQLHNVSFAFSLFFADFLRNLERADLGSLLGQLMKAMSEYQPHWQKILDIVGSTEMLERYRFSWRSAVQQIASHAAFVYWIDNQSLISKETVESWTGSKCSCEFIVFEVVLVVTKIGIDVEDYLIGLCSLPQELVS